MTLQDIKNQWRRVMTSIHWMVHTRKKKRTAPAAAAPTQPTVDDRQTKPIVAVSLLILLGIAIVITFAIKGCVSNGTSAGQSGWQTIIAVVVAILLCALAIRASIPRVAATPTTAGTSPTPPATSKKGHGWVWGLAIVAVIAIIAGYVVPRFQKSQGGKTPESWVFTWQMEPGQMNRQGQSTVTLDVRFTNRDSKNLWAELFGVNGRGVSQKVGGLHLSWVGADLIGEWMNYLDGDGGKCFLYKTGSDVWAGTVELRGVGPVSCRLEKKRK